MEIKKIKKSIFVLPFMVLSMHVFSQKDPVIMTVGGNNVYQSEFVNIYTKNNPNPKYDKASLDEYMDLFVKYKLKVTEAENLQMDTISKFQNELNGYREQLAQPYLTDKEMNEELVKDAYYRKSHEVKAAHILIQDVNATEASRNGKESGAAELKRILEIKKEIESGAISFEDAAVKYSQDPSAKSNQGVLGYFSAFQMVYPFEEAAFTTKVGSISEPILTRFGYHLIKVYDKREARGQIRVAHIYTKAPESSSIEDKQKAEKKINEIYALLESGRDFAELAKEYSDDKTSAEKGGELNWFGTGRMLPEFEEASFSIKEDGQYSKPIQTSYGFHIIKRLEYKPIPPFKEMEGELKNKISKDPRGNKSKESFVEKLKTEYAYKDFHLKWTASREKVNPLTPLDRKVFQYKLKKGFFAPKQKVYVKDLVAALGDKKYSEQAYKEFVNDYFYSLEKSRLEEKYPEYKALMQEYKDGILLFELTDQKVWKEASRDTTGLKAFYEKNKENYQWGKRADAEIYSGVKKESVLKAKELVEQGKNANEVLKEVNQTSQLNLTVEADKFEIEKRDELKNRDLNLGVSEVFEFNGKFIFFKIDKLMAPSIKELDETRGMAISDYQGQLEKDWVQELKNKYKVTINEKVLYSLGK